MSFWGVLSFIISAYTFQMLALYASERFIQAHESCYKLKGHWYHAVIMALFSILAVLSPEKDITFSSMLFASLLYGFLTLFIFLDVERNWLPKCFTFSFIAVGAFYRTYTPVDDLALIVIGVSILWAGMCLFRVYINRRAGGEVFGLGDVYLIVGLAVWFSVFAVLKLIIVATGVAILFLLIKRYRFRAYWHQQQEYCGVPFAPFLCGVAAIWGVLPVDLFS